MPNRKQLSLNQCSGMCTLNEEKTVANCVVDENGQQLLLHMITTIKRDRRLTAPDITKHMHVAQQSQDISYHCKKNSIKAVNKQLRLL